MLRQTVRGVRYSATNLTSGDQWALTTVSYTSSVIYFVPNADQDLADYIAIFNNLANKWSVTSVTAVDSDKSKFICGIGYYMPIGAEILNENSTQPASELVGCNCLD